MRDYLYIPLGGNRRGASRTYFNLWMVFLLSGTLARGSLVLCSCGAPTTAFPGIFRTAVLGRWLEAAGNGSASRLLFWWC